MKNLIVICGLLLCNSLFSQISLDYYLDPNHPYDDNIPQPKSLLGYEVGTWHVSHDKLLSYMHRLAESSDRIQLENRGYTFEGRPILLLTITSPLNHKRITEIQKTHMALTEVGAEKIKIEEQPLVVYQGFSIHGNEPSGSNASLLMAYHLAASQDPETLKMLEELVILFDPSLNPDGLQRFSNWANSNKNQNFTSDSNDREYNEVWPGGRTNHYWFDLNRDWLPIQLPESKARIKTFSEWLPNILTDHHEMGTNSSFFFQPGVSSRVNPLIPYKNQEITSKIASYHIKGFDKLGSLYYSEENYDDFYLGKGSAYPDVNGGIGILFEQASSRGHVQESENGLLTFPFTIRNQLTAAFTTLKAATSMRVEILNYFKEFYSDIRDISFKSKQKAIVFSSGKDPVKSYQFAMILKRHKIKFHKLNRNLSRDGKNYTPKNSYVIPLEQKKHQLIKAMFTKQTKFKDSIFYDVSAWTFPYAFNLNYSIENDTSLIGNEISDIQPAKGKVISKASYAYLFEAHNYYTPKLLNYLLKQNIRVKVGLTPFILNGKKYDYGTYMIPVKNQNVTEEELYTILKNGADLSHLTIHSSETGFTKGIDLGSLDFSTVKKPEIAILVGEGIRSYDAGEIWHLLDTRHDISISKIEIRELIQVNLNRYTHLIIPSFNGTALDSQADKLKEFVREGGTLIGYRYTSKWLNKNKFIDLKFLNKELIAKEVNFENKDKFTGAQLTSGAIFNTILDRTHPINFGFQNENLAVFRNTNIYIEPHKQSYNNPIKYTANPLISGYVTEENLELLKNTVPFQTQKMNRGRVIVLIDNTNFRAFWYGTNRILTNALFLSDKM
ncbi:MAG: zinc carboxypeptidase [Flavobacteriaceae bacterium]|nr:zinc carboxypeptidase [Flavobacteriaceae bacterium]